MNANHPNRSTLYTVLRPSGSVEAEHLTVADAAATVMQYDGHDFEIRPAADGIGFELWTTPYSRNSTLGGKPMTKTVIYSASDDRKQAEAEIFKKVINKADWWKGQTVMPDGDYLRMMVRLHYEDQGFWVRIDDDGHVEFSKDDGKTWLEGRWLSEYCIIDGQAVLS